MASLIYGASRLRSSLFTAEGLLLPFAELFATGRLSRPPFPSLREFFLVRRSLHRLLEADAARIEAGLYPASVLLASEPASRPLAHLRRLPVIFREAMSASRRRQQKSTKAFSAGAKKLSRKLPDYYRRNFHFQRDGYLSRESAEVYDHQVEILFAGAADPMRRLVLAPVASTLKGKKQPRILEIGCGSGSTTRFLREAFPRARITAVDISEPYLELAREKVPGVDFRQALGEKLPFRTGEFDAVVSVFLFHELPLAVRRQVVGEAKRVLKKGGVFAYADSLQWNDDPTFNPFLRRFPVEFHEPFYPNYLRHPMEALVAEAGLRPLARENGFFSKMQAATKA